MTHEGAQRSVSSAPGVIAYDAYRDDIYEVYRRLRDDHPLYFDDRKRRWVLSRYQDVMATASDWRTYVVPTIRTFRSGRQVADATGLQTEDQLRRALDLPIRA